MSEKERGIPGAADWKAPGREGKQDEAKPADQGGQPERDTRAREMTVPPELRGPIKQEGKQSTNIDTRAREMTVPPELRSLRGPYERKADQAQGLDVPKDLLEQRDMGFNSSGDPGDQRTETRFPKEMMNEKGGVNVDAILAARKAAEKAAVGSSEKVVVDAGLQRETTQSTRNREMTGVIEQPKPKTEEKTEPEPGLLKKLWNKIF